ncbi:hypothetical protein [Streptomyces sp. NPDC046805]|uniref:hypothetical protein n=1 Tax=Streptomyces sp. NPDC046805 TaxID=3155134 RepID=UPI0033D57448
MTTAPERPAASHLRPGSDVQCHVPFSTIRTTASKPRGDNSSARSTSAATDSGSRASAVTANRRSTAAATNPSYFPLSSRSQGPSFGLAVGSVAPDTSQSSAQPMMWPPTDAATVSTSSLCRSGDDVASFIRDNRRTPNRHFPHPS